MIFLLNDIVYRISVLNALIARMEIANQEGNSYLVNIYAQQMKKVTALISTQIEESKGEYTYVK